MPGSRSASCEQGFQAGLGSLSCTHWPWLPLNNPRQCQQMAARAVLRQWPRTGSEALSMLVYKCKHACMHTRANTREANVTQHTSQRMALGTGLALGKVEKGTQGAGGRSSPAEAWRCLNFLSPKGHTGTLALEPCPSGPARLPGPAEPLLQHL